jgi:BNR repeat-like domain
MKGARFALVAALVSWAMASGISYGSTWSASKRLTFTAGASAWPDIAINGTNVYVVWHDDTSGGCEIYFRKSTDGGTNWQASKRLTYSQRHAILPAIAVSGVNVYVVWAEDDYGANKDDVYFRRSADGGVTWQAVRRLTYSTDISSPDLEPELAVSGSNIYVVWFDNPSGSDEIYFRKSADGGATWQAVKRLSYASWGFREPAVAVDGSIIHIVWYGDDLCYKKSHDAGSTWMTTRHLGTASASPRPAVDSSGGLHVVSYGGADGGKSEVYYRKSANAGTTWTAARRLTWTAGYSSGPDIAVDPSGNVYVVWYDDTTGNEEIYYRRSPDAGATWPTAERLTFNGVCSRGPSIAATSSAVFIVWMDYTPGNFEIYFKRSIGGSI